MSLIGAMAVARAFGGPLIVLVPFAVFGLIHEQVITDPVGIPAGPPQQVLHPAPSRVTGMLSDRPAVLPGQVSQQSQHERPGPPPGLHPAKPRGHPPHQLIEYLRPPGRVYAGLSGHRTIVKSPHNPR
jgi:hypothetical protein